MAKKRIPERDGAYPYYAVEVDIKKEDIAQRYQVRRGDTVYLYTGQGDWDTMYLIPRSFAEELRPLVRAVREIGAKPVLLSCFHLCYREQKIAVAEILGIPLARGMKDDDVVYDTLL